MKNKGGRPPYVPTDKDRRAVEMMAAYGITQKDISVAVGIAPMTLQKYFANELATAYIKANAKVAETAYAMATSGKCPAATFFWLKCRAHWRETTDLRLTGDSNNPLEVVTRIERVIINAHEDVADRDHAGLPPAMPSGDNRRV
jgi:hypothetical protein